MVLRTVHREDRTVEHLLDLFAKMQQVPNFLEGRNPLGVFLSDGVEVLEIDDVGVLVAVGLGENDSAHAHVTFWDGRLRGREPISRAVAELVMQAYGLSSVWTAIPEVAKQVLAFAERVGFKRFYQSDGKIGLRLERSF